MGFAFHEFNFSTFLEGGMIIRKITKEYVFEICKPGKQEKTCRYLLMGSKGWECAKTDPSMKAAIDSRVNTMTAKADNRKGK